MSLKTKLVLLFLAVAMIPLVFVNALTFHNYQESLKKVRLADLEHVAAFKTDKIETYFAGLKADLEVIRDVYGVKKNLPVLSRVAPDPADPEFSAAKKMLDEILPKALPSWNLFDILLLDLQGNVVYSSNPSHAPVDFSKGLPPNYQDAFENGKKGIFLSDIFFDERHGNKATILATAPVIDLDGLPAGVIVLEMDMAPIYRLIQDTTGLGRTGETLVGKKVGKEVIYLNPLRHDPEAALKRRVPLGGVVGLAIQNAAQGQTGSGYTVDYRGKPVIAAWQYLPSLGWGIVAKIDREEAIAEVINFKKLVIIILVIISVLAGIVAFSIAQSIAGPIQKLSKGAEIIGSGNLDYPIGTIPLKDEIGQLSGAFANMTRDLKRLGLARDNERKRFYDVLETLPVYVVLLSEDYHVPFANKFFRERFGESGGKRCFEYLFNRTEPCENCESYKVMKTGTRHHWEWTGPDGRNYDIYDFPFTDTDGARMILEMGIDITDQKQAEERLRQSSHYVRTLIEASLDPLVTISTDGRITDVNEATIRVTGRARQELIGTDFSSYFTEAEKARAGYREVFAKGFVTDYPLTLRHKDGKLTDVLYNASVYKDTRGNVAGIFAAARDVTELKKAEAELRRHRDSLEVLVAERTSELEDTNKDLSRSNENLEQFAYVASHDLQEPLRVMASYSQLLERRYKGKLDADANEFINFIVEAAGRMQRLITDLLAYSRIGRKDWFLTKVDCNAILRDVIDSMSEAITSTKGKITFDVLPVLEGHETSFMQLFQNLIGNALKFHGPELPRVHVSAKETDGEWLFSVKDNGIGMEPQYLKRIFLIFQRLHSREEYPGTGIGLSICKKIVESHGGRIWVESALGQGSTFYFTVPVTEKL